MKSAEPLSHAAVAEITLRNAVLDIFSTAVNAKYAAAESVGAGRVKRGERKHSQQFVRDVVASLLATYVTLDASIEAPDAPVGLDVDFEKLTEMIEARRADLTVQSAQWTQAQLCRHVLKAHKNLKLYSSKNMPEGFVTIDAAVIRTAKRMRLREYFLSSLWMIAVEVPQLATGWLGGIIERGLIDTRSLLALGIIAGTTRLISTTMLFRKGYLTEKIVEQTGVAPDPFSKASRERWGKAWPGFTAYNGIFELVFTVNSALGIPTLGWPGAFAIEAATNLSPMGIPRQLYELAKMEEQLAIWGVARRTVNAVAKARCCIWQRRKSTVDIFVPADTHEPASPSSTQ